MKSASFYVYFAGVEFKEQFSNLANGVSGFLLFPLFMYVLARLSVFFNGYLHNFTYLELVAYVGFTEVLFMTFLRSVYFTRAAGDFSLSLARPRRWWLMTLTGSFSRTLGNRLIYIFMLLILLPLFGWSVIGMTHAVFRFLLLLPFLTLGQALIFLLFASAQIRWEQTKYLVLPISKIFLVFGGVFGPVADFSEPMRHWVLKFLPSDLFFQPAYFALKGEFYRISGFDWFVRISVWYFLLGAVNALFYRSARKHHQSLGG